MPGPSREAWLRRKPIAVMTAETGADEGTEGDLKRSIGLVQLTSFGVGATVGTGIFFVLQEAVPDAGPAVIVLAVTIVYTPPVVRGVRAAALGVAPLDYVTAGRPSTRFARNTVG